MDIMLPIVSKGKKSNLYDILKNPLDFISDDEIYELEITVDDYLCFNNSYGVYGDSYDDTFEGEEEKVDEYYNVVYQYVREAVTNRFIDVLKCVLSLGGTDYKTIKEDSVFYTNGLIYIDGKMEKVYKKIKKKLVYIGKFEDSLMIMDMQDVDKVCIKVSAKDITPFFRYIRNNVKDRKSLSPDDFFKIITTLLEKQINFEDSLHSNLSEVLDYGMIEEALGFV